MTQLPPGSGTSRRLREPSWACSSLLSQTCPDGAGRGGVSFPTQATPELAAAAAARPRGGLDCNPRSPGRDPDPRSIRRPLGPSVWRYHARAANSLGRGALLPNKGPALIPQPSSGSQQADYPPVPEAPTAARNFIASPARAAAQSLCGSRRSMAAKHGEERQGEGGTPVC